MRLFRYWSCIPLLVLLYGQSISQVIVAGDGDPSDSYKTFRAETTKGEFIELSNVAKLKLFLRKSDYSLNEVMLLDVALLVQSKAMVFVPVDLDINLFVKSLKGKRVNVKSLYIIDQGTPAFRLSSDLVAMRTFKIVIDCAEADDKIPRTILGTDDRRNLFENNLFQTPLEGCIDFDGSGELEIYAELHNQYAATSLRSKENLKTVVGNIRSNILKINIRQ